MSEALLLNDNRLLRDAEREREDGWMDQSVSSVGMSLEHFLYVITARDVLLEFPCILLLGANQLLRVGILWQIQNCST